MFGPARLLTKNRPVQRKRKICCASIGPANGTGVAASRQSEASRSSKIKEKGSVWAAVDYCLWGGWMSWVTWVDKLTVLLAEST